nr:DNA repair protein XRCC4-like [Nerophis lumbriciformis]
MSGAVRQITVTTDPGNHYFLRVDFAVNLSSGFTITLSDGISAWNGEVSEDEVRREANVLELPVESYVEDLHQVLMGGGQKRPHDVDIYSFQLDLDCLKLSYHKMCDDVSVRLGSMKLHPAPHPVVLIREMIGQSLKSNTEMEKENLLLLEDNHKLKEDHTQILKELERHVQDKETMTQDLYAHFVMVLNEKKTKIRSLQDALKPFDNVQKKQRDNPVSAGEDDSPDTREETFQSSYSSQEPTIPITGHNQESQGFSLDHTMSLDENVQPRWKPTQTLDYESPGTSEMN